MNYYNGERQALVNHVAESVGASSGTYHRDGVPGTGVGNRGYTYAGKYAGNYAYPGNYVNDGAYRGY